MMKGCWQSVFQQWEGKNETSVGRSCFGNKNGGELVDWNVLGRNEEYAEQWCLSIVKRTGEGLLTLVFQQWKKAKQWLNGVVSEMRNDEEKADWDVFLEMGRNEKY